MTWFGAVGGRPETTLLSGSIEQGGNQRLGFVLDLHKVLGT